MNFCTGHARSPVRPRYLHRMEKSLEYLSPSLPHPNWMRNTSTHPAPQRYPLHRMAMPAEPRPPSLPPPSPRHRRLWSCAESSRTTRYPPRTPHLHRLTPALGAPPTRCLSRVCTDHAPYALRPLHRHSQLLCHLHAFRLCARHPHPCSSSSPSTSPLPPLRVASQTQDLSPNHRAILRPIRPPNQASNHAPTLRNRPRRRPASSSSSRHLAPRRRHPNRF
mmetsp:Transcript_127668/g.272214  ORF Transcript_127668/g.272214 Transcript_127668/m.272214 type:complete len:221 (+) Transcript_127668:218-880(+)